MDILEKLKKRWDGIDYPFLIHSNSKLYFNDITESKVVDLSDVQSGTVVAIIGDLEPQSILTFLLQIQNINMNTFLDQLWLIL